MNERSVRFQRFKTIISVLANYDINSIIEFGCGNGYFIPMLISQNKYSKIAAIDKNEKKINKLKSKYKDVIFYNGSFLKENNEFRQYDCIIGIEIIEHLFEDEINVLSKIIFSKIKPKVIIFTTPNIEYNINLPILHGGFRNIDHKFEFNPKELNQYGKSICLKYQSYKYYTGFCDRLGATQIIVFERIDANGKN